MILQNSRTIPGQQGRRRLFKSGPAEEAIECRRHERGRAREEFGGPPTSPTLPPTPEKIFEF